LLIETDVLLAALNSRDPLCVTARRVLAHEHLLLSPYSLLELNLLTRAGKIRIREFDNYATKLNAFFRSRGITILPDNPQNHAIAHNIESQYGLTFFDSLHAAAAKNESQSLISFDASYKRLRKMGIKHVDPRALKK
jgi:predicted nucleic acid-binding protein